MKHPRPPVEHLDDGTVKVPLTKGMFALVDAADYPAVAKHSWCVLDLRAQRKGLCYAMSRIDCKIVYLHRFITGAIAREDKVDHENGDGLDCRRLNMKVTTDGKNKRNRRGLNTNNTSGELNVSFDRRKGDWKCEIQVDNKRIHVGNFLTIEQAVKAREKAKAEHAY